MTTFIFQKKGEEDIVIRASTVEAARNKLANLVSDMNGWRLAGAQG